MAIEDLFKIVKERFVAEQPAVPASQEGDVEIPQDLLFKCPRCGAVVYNREFTAAMKVCPKCSYHARLTWQERLELTADKDSFVELDAGMKSLNPIGFPKYEDKIAKMQQQCDMNDAIKTGVCTIRGYRTVIGIMDSHFFMASMGSVVGEKIARAFEYATEHNLPVVMFTASGGARMQEGIILHLGHDRPHHRRSYGFFCEPRRHHTCRAEGAHRLRGKARYPGHDTPAAARRLPVCGVPGEMRLR